MQAVFSDLYDNGITPILTVDVKKHQFYVGPRLTFSRMNHSDYKSYKTRFDHLSEFIIDAGYRYSPLKEHKWLNPNVCINLEYARTFRLSRHYFDHTEPTPNDAPPLFDHSFNLETRAFYQSLYVYGGLGTEITIWKGLYGMINGGLGFGLLFHKAIFKNNDTQDVELVYNQPTIVESDVKKIISIGLGYRF